MRRLAPVTLLLAISACGGPSKPSVESAEGTAGGDEAVATPGAGRIEGVISNQAGNGVSLANIIIALPDATTAMAQAISDQRGRYAIANIKPGTYRVIATHSSLRSEARGVVILADTATALNLRLQADGSVATESRDAIAGSRGVIAGVVFDKASAEPLGGATIEVSGGKLRESIFTLADEKGAFRVPGLAPATYAVSIYYSLIDKGNVEVRRAGVVVEKGVETKLRLEIDTDVRN